MNNKLSYYSYFLQKTYKIFNSVSELNGKSLRPAVKLSSFQAKAVGDSVTVNTDGVILYIIIIQSQDSYTGDSFIFPSGESFGFNSELSAVPNSTFSGSINLRLDENSGKLSVERIIFGDSWTYFLIEVFGVIQPN